MPMRAKSDRRCLPKYTDRQLLRGLRTYARIVRHRPFRVGEFDRWRGRTFCAQTAVNRFGSWRIALSRVGVKLVRRTYTPEELIDHLDRVWKTIGRAPGHFTLAQVGKISALPYRRRWGSLRKCCELLAAHRRGEITRAQLLEPIAPASPSRTLPVELRYTILKRDRYRCALCGQSPATNPTIELHIDHIRPVSQGGPNTQRNLRTLCSLCNLGRNKDTRPKILPRRGRNVEPRSGETRRGRRAKRQHTFSCLQKPVPQPAVPPLAVR